MEELQRKKEELNKRIVDLQSEIEMGTILGDQEMIDTANNNIREINQLISEVDQQIELVSKKEEVKKALFEKYPEQYEYSRIITMSDEELREHMKEQLAVNASQRENVEKELEQVNVRLEELNVKLSEVNNRITAIKEEFKNTHNPELLTEAKEKVAEQARISQDIEQVNSQISSKTAELNSFGPNEMTPEKIKKGMLAQLSGKYVVTDKSVAYGYIKNQQEEGKTNEEIVADLNNTKGNVNGYSEEILQYKDIPVYLDTINLCLDRLNFLTKVEDGKFVYERFGESIKHLEDVMNNSNVDESIKGYCNNVVHELQVAMSFGTPLNKILHGNLSTDFKQHIKYTKNAIDILRVALAYKMMGNVEIPFEQREGLAVDSDPTISTIERYDDILKAADESHTTADYDYMRRLKDEIGKDMRRVHGVLNVGTETIKKNLSDPKLQTIRELVQKTSSEPGKLNVEDIETYIIEQEFAKEQEEQARKESKANYDKLTDNSKREELSAMIDVPEEKVESEKSMLI